MDYNSYQSSLATLMATQSTNTAFQTILPNCIQYAEFRIYRQLDILNTRYRDTSTICTPGERTITLPDTLVVPETIAILTPAGSLPPVASRAILTAVSHDIIDMLYPSNGTAYQGQPEIFAMIGQASALLGPSPDQAYNVEVFGTYRPLPLSASNTTTVLTELLPDLFLAASMVFMAGYQKNFGAQADDPKMALSWEDQYTKLMSFAESEEFRKKYGASSWSSRIPNPVANQQRG